MMNSNVIRLASRRQPDEELSAQEIKHIALGRTCGWIATTAQYAPTTETLDDLRSLLDAARKLVDEMSAA